MSSSTTQPNGSVAAPSAKSTNDTSNKKQATKETEKEEEEVIPSNMSTTALEHKLSQLREQAQQHGQILTQKLATSQSGQNLLHMGSSLSTLPPDLHNLLTQLHPVLAAAEMAEDEQLQALQQFCVAATEIRAQQRRVAHARHCADAYADLVAAETAVQRDIRWRRFGKGQEDADEDDTQHDESAALDSAATGLDEAGTSHEDLDHASSLERAAHIALCLVDDLQSANEAVSALTTGQLAATAAGTSDTNTKTSSAATSLPSLHKPLPQDTERAQFLMKLAPRIRKLESETIQCLCQRMELVLRDIQQQQREKQPNPSTRTTDTAADASSGEAAAATEDGDKPTATATGDTDFSYDDDDDLLLILGHCMRGLALLGRGKDVESIFARIAIMPLIRSTVSMGRLDQGGARGECTGLASLLDEMMDTIAAAFGPTLCYAEGMFDTAAIDASSNSKNNAAARRDVDLLTAGVWVPIATALMADAGIKMAIFSPGIASIVQSNYLVLDRFLAQLAQRLLLQSQNRASNSNSNSLYYHPTVSPERIQQAQQRVYQHAKTAEFTKKWNLPIYYQLRFGECCKRLNLAVETTQREGWCSSGVLMVAAPEEENTRRVSGTGLVLLPERAEELKATFGFELALFLELYDILLTLWRPDVILKPLTNRFLRGAVQMVGRVLAFIQEGMEGKIQFGQPAAEPKPETTTGAEGENGSGETATAVDVTNGESFIPSSRRLYCWGESEGDVGAVAWELAILESTLRHDYLDTVVKALTSNSDDEKNASSPDDVSELKTVISEFLKEACDQIHPLIDKAWNEIIVNILTRKCSAPLAAVKGVAATYRMTNRPPPTQASHFVATILRPLKEFSAEFANRTPERVGLGWKQQIVVTIADKYAVAVEELIATVQRTEATLNRQTARNRRAARLTAAVGMSDGEKVKLQLYLDYKTFVSSVEEAGINPNTVRGLSRLQELTKEGEGLQQQNNKVNGK